MGFLTRLSLFLSLLPLTFLLLLIYSPTFHPFSSFPNLISVTLSLSLQKFFRLTALRRLTLSENDLNRIPPGIANLTRLVELDVSKNGKSLMRKVARGTMQSECLHHESDILKEAFSKYSVLTFSPVFSQETSPQLLILSC